MEDEQVVEEKFSGIEQALKQFSKSLNGYLCALNGLLFFREQLELFNEVTQAIATVKKELIENDTKRKTNT